ncbi:MAG: hypothetical protein ACJ74L_04140 [Gaiellaceae bacterium]
MSKHRNRSRSWLGAAVKRVGPFAAALTASLALVPAASAGTYTDAQGDSGAAGDITAVSVSGDKQSGQVVFAISGTNLASSTLNPLFLSIDSDANPATGDLTDHGADYWFGIDDDGYSFEHWTGSDWVETSYATVRVNGNTQSITISVNRSELGNTAAFNFVASTLFILGMTRDVAPNDGAFNFSLAANGPDIQSVNVQTTPSSGPRAGKRFTVVPTGLKLPPDGRATATPPAPESYSCTAKLGTRALRGTGTGGCAFAIPKAKGKRLTVRLSVTYQGASKVVPLTFTVR